MLKFDLALKIQQVKREMPPSVDSDQKQQQSDGATGGRYQNVHGKTLTTEHHKFKVPKGEKNEMVEAADVHAAFPTTMADIPDAKAVYEARKKREMMRQGGLSTPQDFIPLDDTVRLKYTGPSGERARLVREDENDMSDEEETGSFYSAKKLLQSEEEKRREEQAYFLAMEQGSSEEEVEVDDGAAGKANRRRMGRGPSSGGERGGRGRMEPTPEEYEEEEEEDALQRWEREQIRKGVSSNK
uniref:Protein phosphatase inhibitor 2 n=1 Tax=Globodera pallida TaxID=36090 RepID=A0A183CSB9_GLOPA